MKTSLQLLGIHGLAALFLASTFTSGFAQTKPAEPSRQPLGLPSEVVPTGLAANGGPIANGVYSNSIFRFSLQVPPGWAVVPSANQGTGAARPRPSPGRHVNRTLLIMTENAPLKKSTERKALQVIATRLALPPGPTAAEGFITYSERTAKGQGMRVVYKGNPERVTIHEQHFSKATLTQTTDGSEQHIEQYVTIQGETLLQFVLISQTEKGLKDLQPTIQSLQFKTNESAKPTKRTKKK